MSGYSHHPISIERDEETGALRCTVTVNLLEEYMMMIDRKIAKQGEAAMDAALEAHGYAKERIVRCRDCEYFVFGSSDYATVDWCDYWDASILSSDGFCAWGERREA